MAFGKIVKMCYSNCFLSIIIAFFLLCLCNVPLWNNFVMGDMVRAETDSEKGHALTIVESSDTENQGDHDDGDGVVSVETNDEENGSDNSHEKFEPTSDWKPVKNGQKISPGLHVRLNLQTGEKEAKLMDEPKKKGINEWYAGEKIGVINSEKKRFTREQLKKALKDFKLEESDTVKQKSETKRNKFRSYDELKQAMSEMKMSVKTEAEIVTELMNKLKRPTTNIEDQKTILVDMEYYLHQLDNARLFCDLGGMQVISKLMNDSDVDIRAKATHALGSALQSNAKVQINAVENGILQQLMRMISVDVSILVKKKCLFSLSTLLRQFPHAQKRFLEHGGLSAVGELFSKSQNDQLKIKIITLLTDLVQENDLNLSSSNRDDEIQSERSRQYDEVKMRDALEKSGWCTHLSSLLHQHSGHDSVEKVLSAMTILKETCQNQFKSLHPTLQALSSQYSNLAKIDKEQGETDTFFESIHHNIEQLLTDLKFKREEL